MTNNQISYWNLQEVTRSNKTRENEVFRHNVQSEQLQKEQNAEVARHNASTETVAFQNLEESIRHNRENEFNARNQLAEAQRHAMQTEAQGWATATELNRHNREQEEVARKQSQINYDTYMYQKKAAEAHSGYEQRSNYIKAKDVIYNHQDRGYSQQLTEQKLALDYALGKAKQNIDYALGSWSNRIAQSNSDINRYNADTNYYNANTNKKNADTNELKSDRDFKLGISKQQLEERKQDETERHNKFTEFNQFGSWVSNLFGNTLGMPSIQRVRIR